MHTYIQCQNQQVNRRHIKITYLLMAPEPTRGIIFCVVSAKVNAAQQNKSLLLHNSFFNLLVLFCKSVFVALTRNDEHHIESTKKSQEVYANKNG